MPSLDVDVAASYDDCRKYWNGTSWVFGRTSTYVCAGYNSATFNKAGSGMRWLNITVPKGAIIFAAHLRLHCSTSYSGTVVRSKIRGELTPDAATFADLADFDGRSRAPTTVDWDGIPAWSAGTYYDSPEIKDIIQEIIDQEDWVPGSALVLFWDDFDDLSDHNSNCRRYGGSWNSTTKDPPRLHIEYTYTPTIIDVGSAPIDRPTSTGYDRTLVNKNNPASANVILHTIQIYAASDMTGLRVGTFYLTNGNTLKCRDSVVIGNVESGARRTFTELSITAETGDYIGCWYTGLGFIEESASGYDGCWRIDGEYIDPDDEAEYIFQAGWAISLYGYGDIEEPPPAVGLENKSANMAAKMVAAGLI